MIARPYWQWLLATILGFEKPFPWFRDKQEKAMQPTLEEKYQHMRINALAFVNTMRRMVAVAEEKGNEDLSSKLKVWCLMPWEAALRADESGELWLSCEVCGKPIKDDGEMLSDEDANHFHKSCIPA